MTTKKSNPIQDSKEIAKYERNNLIHILNIKMEADKEQKTKNEKKMIRKRKKI